jgi:beta-glucosidase/6-phospho-beta-glucosidase/beta-galactosidase
METINIYILNYNYHYYLRFRAKFGLYYVDFDDPKRPRKPKKSAKYYGKVVKERAMINSKHFNDEL